MKRKYHGMVAVISAMVALVAVAVYLGSGLWRPIESARRSFQPPALDIKVPSESQVRQMKALEGRMDRLALPSTRSVAAKTLSLFGYQDPAESDRGVGDSATDHAGLGDWQLSLTVRAGINSYCVINGEFIAEGTVMEDGAQVLKIENHRVLILAGQEQQWLYLEDKLSSSADDTERSIPKKGKGQS